MSRICHAHCPDSGSAPGAALAVAIVAAIGWAVVQAAVSAAAGVMMAGFVVLGAAAVAAIVFVKRSCRQVPLQPDAVPVAARRAIAVERRAIGRAPLALPAASSGTPAAHLITDAARPMRPRLHVVPGSAATDQASTGG